MKSFNKTTWLALFITMIFGFTSCKKNFLEENLTTQQSLDYYKTDQGISELVMGAYWQVLDVPFNGEWMYCGASYGTDEFHVGGDPTNSMWNSYDSRLAPVVTTVNNMTATADDQWNDFYHGVSDANFIIENITESNSTDPQIKQTALGAGYFFRAFSYLRLVSQYGAVPLILKPITTVAWEFTRDSVKEIYNQIISDFTQAYDLLPEQSSGPGYLTKDAAAHYLAKAYLFRASEINDSWNSSTQTNDLDSVITLTNKVIADHPLANNFSDLWAYTKPDGPNETLPEIVLSAQFNNNVATAGSNTQHLYYISKYDDLPFMQRDLSGDRPYSRLAATYYMFEIYDMVNDSRFWKSFKTKDRVNNASGGYYTNGDLGIMYVINQPGDTRFPNSLMSNKVVYSKTGKTIPTVYVAYPNSSNASGALYKDVGRFPSLNKYIDASRMGVQDQRGFRDVVLARSAEDYLMAAEAEIRLHNYQLALNYINPVRQRSTWKSGEDREAYIDGGAAYASSTLNQNPNLNSYMPENSYYESNNIAPTEDATDLTVTDINHLPVQDEAIIRQLNYTSEYDRMMCFLLDERSRELAGEFHRWVDLSRTETLVARARAFNPDAAPYVQSYHQLRPIPQTYLDGVQENGRPLTGPERQAQQNPGY